MSERLRSQVKLSLLHRDGGILALDLGTRLGWAARMPPPLENVEHGVMEFKNTRYEGGGMQWVRFRHWLGEILFKTRAQRVVYEQVRGHVGTTAAHAYGGFLSHLAEYCEGAVIPYHGVDVGTIKKFATGKGNAGKDAVILAMRQRGYAPKDNNDADALAMLFCVEESEKW
jgi:crossover junction endodeoxyribonuclease RuvC